jgi:hypothetical protein
MYVTLEFISNVPYYGIFIINSYGVGLCFICPSSPSFHADCLPFLLNKLFVPPIACHFLACYPICLIPFLELRGEAHVRWLLLLLIQALASLIG